MRLGYVMAAVLIGLAIVYGLVFVAGFPLLARTAGPANYSVRMPGVMQGGMPMMPGAVPPAQATPLPGAPNNPQQPGSPAPWMMPGWRQMPMPYGEMPMMRNNRLRYAQREIGPMSWLFGDGGVSVSLLGLWRTALTCIGVVLGAVAFTALGYALGRRERHPAAPAAPAPPPPVEPDVATP